jgi:hypothetical protein
VRDDEGWIEEDARVRAHRDGAGQDEGRQEGARGDPGQRLDGGQSRRRHGPFDFIAVVEGPTLDSVGRLVTDEIGSIDGVTRTTTCLAVAIG